MKFEELELSGAWKITMSPIRDDRGYFMRSYDEEIFAEKGLNRIWVQENQSLSREKGTLRGLHLQYDQNAETKLVRVIQGEILDVIVDMREGSDTYGEYLLVPISAENSVSLYVPRGFAHGFVVVEAPAIVTYKVDNKYCPESEGGLLWNDPELLIPWPIENPIISEKDKRLPLLRDARPVVVTD